MLNQIKYGVLLSYATIILNNLVYILFTPFLLKSLGQANYGLYILMGSLIGYIALLDVGLTNAIIRYLTKEKNKLNGDQDKIVSLFFYLYLFISSIIIVVGIIVFNFMDRIFVSSMTIDELELAKQIFILLILNLAISLPLNTFNSVIIASEKFIFVKSIGIMKILIRIILLIVLLSLDYGVLTIVIVDTLLNLFIGSINVFYAIINLKTKIILTKIKFSFIKDVFSYSFFIFIIMIADIINQKSGHLILGIKMNTESVAIFGITFAIIGMFVQISSAVTNVFIPRITRLSLRKEDDQVFKEFIQVSRLQLIIVSLVFSGYILYGKAFVHMWAGPTYEDVWMLSVIILIPVIFDLIQNLGVQVLYAKNKHNFRAMTMLITSIMSVFISLILLNTYGIVGVAIGTSISYIVGNVLFTNMYYHFKMNMNMFNYYKYTFKGVLLPVISTVLIMFLIKIEIDYSWLNLVINIIIHTLIFALLTLKFGLNKYESEKVMKIFKRMKSNSSKIFHKIIRE